MSARGLSDTSPAAARVQVALLREATPARRFELCRALSRTVIELSRRALREARPRLDDAELMIEWVAIHYGREVAEALRRDGRIGR